MNNQMDDQRLLDIKEFMRYMPYCDRHIRRLIGQGKIEAVKFPNGRKWLIPFSEINRFKNREANLPAVEATSPRTEKRVTAGASLKREHFRELARVAKTILSPPFDGIVQTSKGDYEFDRYEEGPYIAPMTMSRDELVKGLHENIEDAYDKHRSMNLFEHFMAHLGAESLDLSKLDKSKLHEYVETHPTELIESLKLLVTRKTFKGKCPVCKDWH
jgi:excisionase family DNA binding protein